MAKFLALLGCILTIGGVSTIGWANDVPPPPPNDRPPSANPGEAWCRIWIAPKYEERTRRVMVSPGGKVKKWIAPVYSTRTKLKCVSPIQIRERHRPAKYRVRKVEVPVPGKTRCVCTKDECGCPVPGFIKEPDGVRIKRERVCDAPGFTCFEHRPAMYKSVEERYLVKPGYCEVVCVPPKYRTTTTRVCVEPGRWAWRRNPACEVPAEEPLAALQVELVDQKPSGVEEGIFRVGETVRYNLKVAHDDGSTDITDLKVVFQLPPELKFVSAAGAQVSLDEEGREARTEPFTLAVGQVKSLQVMAQVVGVSATNMIQMVASVQSVDGSELARESESTTVQ